VTTQAVSFNFTITLPTALGDLRTFPGGGTLPLVSTMHWRPGQTRANNAIVPLGSSGDLVVHVDQASGTVHFLIDVKGPSNKNPSVRHGPLRPRFVPG